MKKIFTFIAAALFAVGANAQTDVVKLNAETYDAAKSDNGTWYFTGTDITITPDGGRAAGPKYFPEKIDGESTTAETATYAALNVKKDSKQSIILPTGVKLYRIQITGFSQGDNFDYLYAWGQGDAADGYEWADPIGKGITDNSIINSQAQYPIDPCGWKGSRVPESTREVGYIIADIDFGNDPYEGSFSYFVSGNNQADLNYTLYLSREAADAASGEVQQEVWTVAGGSNLLGANWDPADASNQMKSTDGINYTLVKEGVAMEKGVTYEFKVVKGTAWGEEYPSSNYQLTVDETATYNVTIKFNATSHDISVETEKTGEAVIGEKTYSVMGTINGNWDVDTEMTKGDDGIYTAKFENVKAGTYKFKVRVNKDWAEAYPGSDYSFTVDNDGSTVTITFNPETKEVKAEVSGSTGINVVKAAANNAAIYNLAGQKVANGFKGIVIMNGRKMIQK